MLAMRLGVALTGVIHHLGRVRLGGLSTARSAVFFIVLAMPQIGSAQGHELNLEQAQQAAEAQLAQFMNVMADYRRVQVRQPHPGFVERVQDRTLTLPDRLGPTMERDQREFQHHFRFLNGMSRHEQRLSEEQAQKLQKNGKVGFLERIQVVANGRSEAVITHLNLPEQHYGTINSPEAATMPDASLDVLFGSRLPKRGEPTGKAVLSKAVFQFEPANEGGQSLLKATFRDSDGHHVWYFDPSLGYSLLKYHQLSLKSGKLVRRIYVEKTDLEQGVPMPVSIIDERISHAYGQEAVIEKNQMFVDSYRFNAPENTPDSYAIDWPKGTVVVDERTGLRFQAGNVSFQEKEIMDEMMRRIDEEPSSSPPVAMDTKSVGEEKDPTFGIEPVHLIADDKSNSKQMWGVILVAFALLLLAAWYAVKKRSINHDA